MRLKQQIEIQTFMGMEETKSTNWQIVNLEIKKKTAKQTF